MNHLTDDQIDDLLVGDAPADSRAHLDACSGCAARLAAAYEPLASFNATSLAWGERRSATLPLQLQRSPAGIFTGGRLRLTAGALGTAAAALFALALAHPLLHHRSATETAHQTAAAQQPPPQTAVIKASVAESGQSQDFESETPAQQIARDNQLLQAIDRELASSETPASLLKMSGQQASNQSSPDVAHND